MLQLLEVDTENSPFNLKPKHLTAQIFILNNLFCLFIFLWFLTKLIFFTDFDGYYIVRTDEGQPRQKYIFNKCGTNIYFLLYRGLVHHHHRILN